ncbi:uncharacterized protein LOC131029570 isoform X2 [Cryptomeria japonica]|uniref:uncharacterized protein LOC131029570 isoform X2 n=1 Tax=Cryptomeria japonica TaxID=3369 RepID=UPI0025AD2B04|nr:uncharacterized protein LOC131029570 isoform X2 [Cryptomeria japonica]
MDHQEVRLEIPGTGTNVNSTSYDPAGEKSWYILTILARVGRPSTPEEISERCRFISITPAEILHLCCIPGSPLYNVDGLITCSPLAVHTFDKFCSNSVLDSTCTSTKEMVNELRLKGPRKRLLGEVVKTVSSRQAKRVCKPGTICALEKRRQSQNPSPLGRDSSNISPNLVGFGVGDGVPEVNKATTVFDGAAKCDESFRIEDGYSGGNGTPGEGVLGVGDGDAQGYGVPGVGDRDAQGKGVPGAGDRVTKDSVAPEIEEEAPTGDNKRNSFPLEHIRMEGGAETGAVDINIADATIQSENCKSPVEPMQSSGSIDENCDANNEHFHTYKRQKRELSETQFDYMDKDVFHSDTRKMDFKTCSIVSQVQASIKPDGIQNLKLEDERVKHEHATVVGDAVVSLQACIPSTKINQIPEEGVPTKDKITNCSIAHISPEGSVIDDIFKGSDGKCEKKGAQILKSKSKSELPSEKKIKKIGKAQAYVQEEMDSAVPASNMNDVGLKRIPQFESFIVEEEEGSGGYGTVYKARRKQDGKSFAIKCPLEKTSSNYVTNEIKMLERFGGKNFIIKYEGAFNENDCDCLILQHVEHEKPEVLRKEINISQIRWYGYCMFKALQALHKQGIIHRDVKPGNFLFSRKSNKGFLIDFNLALDQYDPNAGRPKPKMLQNDKRSIVAAATHKPPFYSGRRDIANIRHKALIAAADTTNQEKQTRQVHVKPSGNVINLKRKVQTTEARQHDSNNHRTQSNLSPDTKNANHKIKFGERTAVKVSGLHLCKSASKDMTSARTPSGGNRREPLPSQGRKELLNLIHLAQQSPEQHAPMIPVSQRKRVAAPQERFKRDNGGIVHVSPMPFQPKLATGTYGFNDIQKNKDSQKFKRDGPCVGTRGYRAPEVLLRSLHQGCKLDIWSAGVTLLYLMAGRIPFQAGSPDQAIRDIAKIRGKEEIWEIAKLHDRESSLPADLYKAESGNVSIEEWCKNNTKRPEFLDSIPTSLYDLVDKCLCVNPRQRIDADQALEHDFFSPCYEVLKRTRSSSRESVLTDVTSTQTLDSGC